MKLPQGQDRSVLQEQEYADDAHLDVRIRTHQLYTVDSVDFGRWTLERLTWRGDERVLDIGCGPGELLSGMARHHVSRDLLVGFDFSPGMVAKAARTTAGLPVFFFVGDAQAIPCPDDEFDIVMARHMLYHVPDIERAVAEAARVLRPGGQFLATTNSAHTMPEYEALRKKAARRFPSMIEPEMVTKLFSLENGPSCLKPHFDRVEICILTGTLRFPTVQPLIDYFASSRSMIMQPGHSDKEWEEILDFVRTEVQTVIARQGHFDVQKITGAIVGFNGS